MWGRGLRGWRLALSRDFEVVRVEEFDGRVNLLEVVFRDGRLLKDYSFDEILSNF